MLQNKYVLEFLPMFYDDLAGIVDYITMKQTFARYLRTSERVSFLQK